MCERKGREKGKLTSQENREREETGMQLRGGSQWASRVGQERDNDNEEEPRENRMKEKEIATKIK